MALLSRGLRDQARQNLATQELEEFLEMLTQALEDPEVRQMIAQAVADEWNQSRKRNGGRGPRG